MENVHLKEWEVARDTLKAFDERVHDIRKYGFSFLTALLTAEAFLIPGPVAESVKEAYVPNLIKLCVLAVTLVLIVAIRIMERNYELFIKAIVQRASILERTLNIELTDTISHRHKKQKAASYNEMLYVAFVVAVLALGLAILWQDPLFVLLLAISCFVAAFVTTYVIGGLSLYCPPKWVDWSLDRNQCQEDESVVITLTNLCSEPVTLAKGVLFKAKTVDGLESHSYSCPLNDEVVIRPEGSYVYVWTTKGVSPGTYQVFPESRDQALRRTITVMKKEQPPVVRCPMITRQTDD